MTHTSNKDQMETDKKQTIAIIGAGLVGTLNAIFLAKKGYKIDIFEARKDVRILEGDEGRSINLSFSTRGLEALKAVGIEKPVIELGVRGYGRMIHSENGAKKIILYGYNGENLVSVNRRKLNECLVNEASKFPNIKFHFEHKLTSVCLKKTTMLFERPDKTTIKIKRDIIFGNDGAYSIIRKEMLHEPGFVCELERSDHKYIELIIPSKNAQFPLDEHYVHIWPRYSFLLLALPNQDHSFTCTLSMPNKMFQDLKTKQDVLQFFQKNFPDALELMGIENLTTKFFARPPSSFVSVKCNTYHYKSNVLIMGDAAHAMVPFYAQGMNCAFEDCLILSNLLEKYRGHFGDAFQQFSAIRCPDAHVICDLSYYNYLEMRSLVQSRTFLARKVLTNYLSRILPGTFQPLYNMVVFSRIPYNDVIKQWKWQNKIINRVGSLFLGISTMVIFVLLYRIFFHLT